MLSLQIKYGEYITIGENVVIQVFQRSGSQFRLAIQAPRELSIVRGEVRERQGNARPESVCDPSNGPMVRQQARRMQRLEARQKAAAIRADAVQQLRTLLHQSDAGAAIELAVALQLERLEQSEILATEGGATRDGTNKNLEHDHQSAP